MQWGTILRSENQKGCNGSEAKKNGWSGIGSRGNNVYV